MIYIGLNELQTKVAHSIAIGKTHKDIAQELNLETWEVIAADIEAIDIIRKNNCNMRNETDIRKMLKVTFLIMICLLPMERARSRINQLRLRCQTEMII